MTYWIFQKPDEERDPFVIIASNYKKSAQKKLLEIVDGHGYLGTWEQTKLTEKDAEPILKKFALGYLYQKEANA